ncbi:MAG: hypothetical protein P8179_07330 [Candidatus Thiodiazotropha sp.]|jgi:hypothetical protein
MDKTILLDKYPVYSQVIDKNDTECKNIDDVMVRLKEKIEAHPIAAYIGDFDHYAHVAKQPEGKISDEIKASKHALFCVANAIPNPLIGAARPRAISVVELVDKFVISYLEAPVEKANQLMADWVGSLKQTA